MLGTVVYLPYLQVLNILSMNWEYITGFFDADGSISAIKMSKNQNKTIQISFHNCELVILEEIKCFILKDLRVRGTISRKPARKESHQDSYDLKYTYQNAFKVSKNLNTRNPKKKHRIKIYSLIQESTKRNGKYSEEELSLREKLLLDFFLHK